MSSFSRSRGTKAIASWCLYDFANSAFNTLVVTFVYSTYFGQSFAADVGRGTALWSRGVTVSALLIAALAPIAGVLADRGDRRRYLIACTLICVVMTATLAFIRPTQPNAVVLALVVFVLANVAFEIGLVFYNAFLPSLVLPSFIGRVSGYGWSLGYLGGLASLALGLTIVMTGPRWFGISMEDGFNVRATNLLVAGWFLLFSIPLFVCVRDEHVSDTRVDFRGVFEDLRRTLVHLGRYREMVRFLLARLVYNDGLVTIFAFSGLYAMGTFDFSVSEVMVFGIVLNVVAGLGAWIFGFVDDQLGGKVSITISLVFLTAATFLAAVAPDRAWLWVAGCAIGFFLGPNQSASRSLMARFVPKRHESEFFGFFAFSGKVTAFLGPLLLGALSDVYTQRAGVMSIVFFFIVGGVLLWRVDERAGIAAAR